MINKMQNLPDPPSQGGSTIPVSASGNTFGSDSFGQPAPSQSGGLQKEQEPFGTSETASLEEIHPDIELEPQLTAMGVSKKSETIELPADVARMGVTAVGPAQPVTFAKSAQLPLTDDQIIVGLHAQIISSLRWLAQWCVRQLRKAHVSLKKINGKIVREAT